MIAVPGAWKNFEEIEESLSLAELNQILDSYRKVRQEDRRFFAAIQGIDLDKSNGEHADFEEVKRRAEAKLRGMSEEELELSQVGISIEEWED